jgi:hypothetical protein
VLVGTLGLLLLLDGGDDAPGGTAGTNNVLVGNGEEVALIDSEFAANLENGQFFIRVVEIEWRNPWSCRTLATSC